MATVKTYDPKQVVVNLSYGLNFATQITGFADGTAIKIVRTAEAYSKTVGMDGDTSRVKNSDRSGECTLTLAQTSPSNDFLTAMANATSDGDVGRLTVTDIYSGSEYSSAYVWVKKPADVEYGKSLSNREWVLECADLDMNTKGSTF